MNGCCQQASLSTSLPTISYARTTLYPPAFYVVSCVVDNETAVDKVYLDFSNAFDKGSHSILVDNFVKYGLDNITVRWIHTWLNNCTQC